MGFHFETHSPTDTYRPEFSLCPCGENTHLISSFFYIVYCRAVYSLWKREWCSMWWSFSKLPHKNSVQEGAFCSSWRRGLFGFCSSRSVFKQVCFSSLGRSGYQSPRPGPLPWARKPRMMWVLHFGLELLTTTSTALIWQQARFSARCRNHGLVKLSLANSRSSTPSPLFSWRSLPLLTVTRKDLVASPLV